MVISCLTIYVIAFSSVFLVGKSYVTAMPDSIDTMVPRHDYRRNTEMHFEANMRTPGSSDIAEASKADLKLVDIHYERAKIRQSSLDTSNERKPSEEFTKNVNASSSYFALYDPVNHMTKKLEVSGRHLPSDISYRNLNSLVRSKHSSENPKEDLYLKRPKGGGTIKNFIEWDTLRDSEKEIRIHYRGISAKETIVKTGVDEETNKRQGLKLRQLTDGKHFIQLIYNFENEIQDCEYIEQKPVVENFLKAFRDNVENAKQVYESELKERELSKESEKQEDDEENDDDDDDYFEKDEGKIEKYSLNEDLEQYEGEEFDSEKEYRNVTFQIIRSKEDLPRELAEWLNYSKLKRKCRENHKILRQLAFNKKHGDALAKKMAEEHIERMKRSLDFPIIFPGTKWCGKSHIAEKYTALGGFSKTDKCCRAHDHCHPLISGFEEKFGFYNLRPFTINHCRCDSRRKRDIMDVLLVPGTKWCGKGRRATKYTSLGGFSRTDKCCRVHDTMCPHWIGSLEEKYGFFNWRINTIMHCRCDKRFRACLKMAKTGTANFVGKLFFNVVQTKCFVLKPQEVCLSYSWWGKCEKKEFRKKAYLRDNLTY